MANIKSAKKRVLVSQAKADRNKSARSKVKTYIKKVESAVAAGDKAAAQAAAQAPAPAAPAPTAAKPAAAKPAVDTTLRGKTEKMSRLRPVSYTHLTLPTN